MTFNFSVSLEMLLEDHEKKIFFQDEFSYFLIILVKPSQKNLNFKIIFETYKKMLFNPRITLENSYYLHSERNYLKLKENEFPQTFALVFYFDGGAEANTKRRENTDMEYSKLNHVIFYQIPAPFAIHHNITIQNMHEHHFQVSFCLKGNFKINL